MRKRSYPKQANRPDIYERVTNRILEQLERGVAPWQSPCFARVGFPRNYQSQKTYSGINVFLLGMMEFSSPYFLTYKQAQAMGGNVRKGEKGFIVVKFGTYGSKTEIEGEEETIKSRYLKGYTVFNASQIEGITFPEIAERKEHELIEAARRAASIVQEMPNPPQINEGRFANPHYIPSLDEVNVPDRGHYPSENRFYKTLFRELTHSTGHPSLLARETLMKNGGNSSTEPKACVTYSKEELIAEMGAAFLGTHAEIIEDDHENSAAYLQGWATVLKLEDNRNWLVSAASQAQKAVNYILGEKRAP